MRHNEFTKILGWPGYRVFRYEIDETAVTLRLWVRRKRGNRKLICSGCGRNFTEAHDYYQREVRDLPWRKYQTTVIIELYRVCCPECGVKIEKVPQLPGKAPFSKDFEDAVGLACESASVRQVARQFGLLPARCERSTCGICNAGVRRVAKTHWYKWVWMRFTLASG